MKKNQIVLYILIALVLVAAAAVILYLSPAGETPDIPVVLPTDTTASGEHDTQATPQPTEEAITVNADNVQIVLATLIRAENYSRTLTVENFWSGGSSLQSIDVAVRGASSKIIISGAQGELSRHILLENGEKWIWYSDSEGVYHGSASDGDTDRYQTLLSYEEILELDRSAILEAGYTTLDGCVCISVRYVSGLLGYESLACIDVASGLLLSLETYDGDQLIYRMSSTVPDLSTPDEGLFLKP